jgi:2-methylcitrate dehydratase PrpD
VATILALAEMEQKSGKELLAAYLVGLDVGVAIGKSVANAMYSQGMHNTSSLGIIASAAAAAHLLDLDEEQTVNALAIATTQAFGLKRSFGTMSKPLHAGEAAEAAVEAALLARNGFTGASDILEGPNGLLEVFGGEVNQSALDSMGQDWGLKDLSVKFHAACHWTHGAIETTLLIAERDGVKPDDIESAEFTVSPVALKTAGVVQPETGLEGKFSIPYSAMNGLVTGKTGIQGYTDEAVKNQEVAELIDKTKVVTAKNEDWFYTEAKIRTTSGDTYMASVSVFKELPGFEEKLQRVKKKFTDLVIPILGQEKTRKVEETILSLDTVSDVSDLNKSEGLQYIQELAIKAVEKPLSGYMSEVWD